MLLLVTAVMLASSEPTAAGLAPRFVEVQAAAPGEQPTYEGWTTAQLETEQRRLEESRPSVALPALVLGTGVVVAAGDFFVFFFGGALLTLTGGRFDTPFIVGMAVFGVVGAALILGGVLLLRATLQDRAAVSGKLNRLRDALERLAPAAPPEPIVPPPAVPYQPQVRLAPPWFAVTLARF